MSHDHTHEHAQEEELAFWQTPGAEFGEQIKQLTYSRFLGLNFVHDGNSPYVIDRSGKRILDVGGGPVSLLLKTVADEKAVLDPCPFDSWVDERYKANGVHRIKASAENIAALKRPMMFDEIWMYNVLQHTEDPAIIFANIYNCLEKGGTFRFLDWINTPTNGAHPITLTEHDIFDMLGAAGFTDFELKQEVLNENGAVGEVVYGVFTK